MLDIRPYYVARNPSNGSAVYWTRDNNAALPLIAVLVTCSGRINKVVMTNVFCHDIEPSFNMFENYDSVD